MIPTLSPPRSYRHDLETDLGFPPGSFEMLQEWTRVDSLLHVWGETLLR